MDGLIGFILAAVALAGSPGPATLSLAAAGAAFGPRGGLGYLAGLTIGIVLVMLIVASGLAGLMLALPGMRPVVTTLAAVYFIYLAYRIATAPPLSDDGGARRRPSLVAGILLSLVNPKGYVAMAALFSGFVLVPGRVSLDAAAKVVVVMLIVVVVNLIWLGAGALLTRFFRDPRSNRALNIGFALLLIASLAAVLVL